MTPADAVKTLDEMEPDPESAHIEADAVLCRLLISLGHPEVAEAFAKLKQRAGFWYA